MQTRRLTGAGIAAILIVFAAVQSHSSDLPTLSLRQMRREALRQEVEGNRLRAADLYERIVEQDPQTQEVVSRRLATLYAQCGVTNKALAWAAVVMQGNPDPQAYLAGIHMILGTYTKAEVILRREVDAAQEPRRKMVLLWQLADVHEKSGNLAAAEATLKEAVKRTKDTPDSAAANQLLHRFEDEHRTAPDVTDDNL